MSTTMPRITARYAWHADSYDPSLASIRYRLLEPLAALVARGVSIARYDQAIGDPAAILLCKSHGVEAVALARAARAANRAVVYDLCDNLFAAHRAGHVSAARLARHREILALATHVTFATPALADQIACEAPGFSDRRWVVPDVLDTGPPAIEGHTSPIARWELARLNRFLARHPTALHCVWFGKSLGHVSGYAHLEAAVARLITIAQDHPVTLTVISNDRLRLWRAASRWRLPVLYTPWRLATARVAIARHRVAVIPVERNDYTAGKTINRPATAILAGLGVVADAIPSYEELRPFVFLDDWEEGLDCYRAWTPATQATLAAARAMLTARYSADAVADRWESVLATIKTG